MQALISIVLFLHHRNYIYIIFLFAFYIVKYCNVEWSEEGNSCNTIFKDKYWEDGY